MTNVTVGSWIARRGQRTPDRTAIIFDERVWSYRDFDARIRRLGNGLRDLGVRHGDRVGYLGANHPAFLETLFAAGSLGAIAVPINHRLSRETVAHILQDVGCRVLIHDGSFVGIGITSRVTLIAMSSPDDSDQDETDYERLLANATEDRIDTDVTLDDIALIVYTSGTSGPPKGVTLTHGNLTWNVMNFLVGGDFRRDDVTLAIAPFFRMGATGVTVLETILLGGTVVVMSAFDPRRALELIERHRVTVLFGGPDLMQALIEDAYFSEQAFSTVRVCYTGGAPVPRHLLDAYQQRGIPFIQGYGLSEAAPLALLLDPEDTVRKEGSAGRPAFFCDVRVARDDGSTVVDEEVGEVLVAGPNVMKGYWNRTRAGEHLLDGRWLRTGDAARVDAEGFITIVGRMKDAFVSQGRRIHPGDIEEVLRAHPDVGDAVVVGIPDEAAGQVGAAFVEAGHGAVADPDSILAWLGDKLEPDLLPRSVKMLPRLPRNPAGKVLRRELMGQEDR